MALSLVKQSPYINMDTFYVPFSVHINGSVLTLGGGASAFDRGGAARRNFWIKPLKETDLGVAQAFFDP